MRILLILLLTLSLSPCFAQKLWITDTTNQWIWLNTTTYTGGPQTGTSNNLTYGRFYGDSVVGTLRYSVYGNSATSNGLPTAYTLLREDTIDRKVYVKRGNAPEEMLYDYNWSVNDIIDSINNEPVVITSIDTVIINGNTVKAFLIEGYFSQQPERTKGYIIEGFGYWANPTVRCSHIGYVGASFQTTDLKCFSNSTGVPIGATFLPATSIDTIFNAYMDFTGCGDTVLNVSSMAGNKYALSIYPQPAHTVLNIALPETITSGTFTIINHIGQMVYNKNIEHTSILKLNDLPQLNGICFYRIVSATSSEHYTGKLIFEQ